MLTSRNTILPVRPGAPRGERGSIAGIQGYGQLQHCHLQLHVRYCIDIEPHEDEQQRIGAWSWAVVPTQNAPLFMSARSADLSDQ